MKKYTQGKGLKIVERESLNYIEKAFAKQLASIEDYNQKLEALAYGFRGTANKYGYNDDTDKSLREAYSLIKGRINENLNDCYQNMFMFSTISTSPKVLEAARQIAYGHFLKDAYTLSHYFDGDFSYNVKDKAKFKKDLHQLARKQGHRKSMMDDRSVSEDITNMKQIIQQQKARIVQLEQTLQTVYTLAP